MFAAKIAVNMPSLLRQSITYLALVYGLTCVPYVLMIHSHHYGQNAGLVMRLLLWCPALAAILTCKLLRIDLSTLGWNWKPVKHEAFVYLLPVLYATPVYIVCWIAVKGSFALSAFEPNIAAAFGLGSRMQIAPWIVKIPLLATLGVAASLANALGEEIGWRGFLLPRLTARFGFTLGCLANGLTWAAWHYPILVRSDFSGTDPAFAFVCFTLMVTAMAYILGWLRLKTGSLWPCALLHASHNLFIQSIFDRITAPVGYALYITTEVGAGLVLTAGVAGLVLWSRRKELPAQAQAYS
jgi:uncharacterized protein